MDHLTEEQLEGILQSEGAAVDLAHVKGCQDCRNRLVEKRAIAARLRSAFNRVEAGPALAERIRSRLNATTGPAMTTQSIRHTRADHRIQRLWPTLAAAAAVLVVVVPLSLYFGAPSTAKAAHAELVRIHTHNLSPDREFHSETDPRKLAEYFRSKLGFDPHLPELGHGMALRGCCVKHFRGKAVGSYVVDTPDGVMSVVVVTDQPESLGMADRFKKSERTYWKSSFAKCDMVAVRIGDYSYCAVGEISHEYLVELLNGLIPEEQK